MATSDIKKGPLYVDSTNNRVGIGTASPATALDVTGTATINGAAGIPLTLNANSGGNTNLQFNEGGALRWYLRNVTGSNDFNFYGNGNSRLNIGSGGDISFYNPSGTAKFFWDASAESLGIGTSSPSAKLDLQGTAAGNEMLEITHSGASQPWKFISGENGVTNEALIIDRGASGEWLRFHAGVGTVFSYDNTERLRIDSGGRLLIGATLHSISSLQKFEVQGGIAAFQLNDNSSSPVIIKNTNSVAGNGVPHIVLQDSSGNRGGIYRNSSSEIGLHGQGSLTFHTGGTAPTTERMRIDSSGRLLLNATVNNVAGSSARSQIRYSKTGEFGLHIRPYDNDTGGGQPVLFQNYAGGTIGSIGATASATSYNTSSDYRLKTDVTYDWDATSRLKQLKPARFAWIVDGDDAVPVDGFLAHEVQSIVPEAITGTHNEVDDEGNPVYQGIDQGKLVPLLVKTIQELEARIAVLEAK